MRRRREGSDRPPADRPITSEPVGMRRSKGGVRFGACTGVRPFAPRSRVGESLRVRQVGSFGFLWAEPAGSFGRRARTRRRGGRAAGARHEADGAHLYSGRFLRGRSADGPPRPHRVMRHSTRRRPSSCSLKGAPMWIVLARATDEQVVMHVSERRLWLRDFQLRTRNSKRIFGDGYARSRRRPFTNVSTYTAQFGLSRRAPERCCERNAP